MHLSLDVDTRVSDFRRRQNAELGPAPRSRPFENPGPGTPVPAEDFLRLVDLRTPQFDAVLVECYPRARQRPDLLEKARSRLLFWAWATLKGFGNLHAAYQAARIDLTAMRALGFEALPCYETLRCFVHERLRPDRQRDLEACLLREMKRLKPDLGREQVQDATPQPGLRRDDSSPFSPHYGIKMQRLELRWDPDCEALLGSQFYHGNAGESRWANIFTKRLAGEGVGPLVLTVDNGYAGFQNHAYHARHGIQLVHKNQESWVVDEGAAKRDIVRRFKQAWRHPAWPRTGDWNAGLRFLFDWGSNADREAVGRWARDHELTTRTAAGEDSRRLRRSQNEGLNAELKRLPVNPQRRGGLWALRRFLACTLTMMLVQLTRLQHGVQEGLCRTAYIK